MLIINNKALKITNKWLNPVAGSGPTPPGPTPPGPTPPTYYHVYTSATNGTITATPVSGISGTTVTLSNTPDTGYEFDSYSLTGATLYDTNKFDINNSDVNVVGNFIASGPTFDEVTIGTQTWMAKNLAIDDDQGGIYTQTVNYGNGNITEYYYTWAAAVRVANSISGWHLPTKSECDALATTAGGSSTAGTKLKSTTGWNSGRNGTDDFGFTAYPAGYWLRSTGSFFSKGYEAAFWTATEFSSYDAYAIFFDVGSTMNIYNQPKSDICVSVRLIKNT